MESCFGNYRVLHIVTAIIILSQSSPLCLVELLDLPSWGAGGGWEMDFPWLSDFPL